MKTFKQFLQEDGSVVLHILRRMLSKGVEITLHLEMPDGRLIVGKLKDFSEESNRDGTSSVFLSYMKWNHVRLKELEYSIYLSPNTIKS